MDAEKKFWLIESLIFLALALITFIEIHNFLFFKEFFMRVREYVSWFLGLTVGAVVPNWVAEFKRNMNRKIGRFLPDERFLIFLVNLVIMTVAVGLAKELSVFFLKRYFEFFHIIFLQWVIVVYAWFKLENNFKINMRYIVAAEILVILFSMVITFTL